MSTETPQPLSPSELSKARRSYHELRVARIVRETRDASSVVFEIPTELGEVFRYEAGQFLTLQVPYRGKKLFRCYSLASSPVADDEHKVTVKRVFEGRISNWVNDSLDVGDVVSVLPPAGDFVLDHGEHNDLILFGGGSGITPMISIVKTALVTSDRRIKLIYANRDRDSIIFRDELDELAHRHADRFTVVHRLDVEHGFLDSDAVRAYVDHDVAATFYICGPGPFMVTVEETLRALGVDERRLHIERFSSPADGEDLGSQEAGYTDRQGHTVTIHLDGQRHELLVRPGETVLAAAKRAKLEAPFSCESGFCGCCMATLKRGACHMKVNDFLQPDEIEEGWVLTCQAVCESDEVEIEYPD
jgi:3-ketosteroid 9alpha-monooxygenase subunit B